MSSTPNLHLPSQSPPSKSNPSLSSQIEKKGPWLSAWKDPFSSIKVFSSCLKMGDVRGDGEYRLLIASENLKFLIYKGINIEIEQGLTERPIGIEMFYNEVTKNPCPLIAIACESSVYIYKNLKPYFKFILPVVEMPAEENALWRKYENEEDLMELLKALSKLKNNGFELSKKSMELLTLKNFDQQKKLFNSYKDNLFTSNSPTCMETLKKNAEEEFSLSHLIIGTELKKILILDNQGVAILTKIDIPGVPVQLKAHGLLEQDYKLFIACRNNKIYFIKNGKLENFCIDAEAKISSLIKIEKFLYTACINRTIYVYNLRGANLYELKMSQDITNITALEFGRNKQIKGLLVALSSLEIRLYKEKQLIYSLPCDDIVAGMCFGYFGREDGCLAIVYKNKGIDIKILQRQFNFSTYLQKQGSLIENDAKDTPLNIPKKTKLFLEDTQRERDQSHEVHRNYQKDLVKMRLQTAKFYYNLLSNGENLETNSQGNLLRIHSSISGLGPLFILKLSLLSLHSVPLVRLSLTLSYDPSFYRINKAPPNFIPLLIPNVPFPVCIGIECVEINGNNDCVKIMVRDKKEVVAGVIIQMPVSEIRIE